MTDCDLCCAGKSHQLAYPKKVDNNLKLPFQLVIVDLMGPLTPEALGRYMYVTKMSEYNKWTEIYLLKSTHDALSSFQIFARYVGDPQWFPRGTFKG